MNWDHDLNWGITYLITPGKETISKSIFCVDRSGYIFLIEMLYFHHFGVPLLKQIENLRIYWVTEAADVPNRLRVPVKLFQERFNCCYNIGRNVNLIVVDWI